MEDKVKSISVKELKDLLKKYEDTDRVYVREIEEGEDSSDRYGIGMGLFIKDERIKGLGDYIQTGCMW